MWYRYASDNVTCGSRATAKDAGIHAKGPGVQVFRTNRRMAQRLLDEQAHKVRRQGRELNLQGPKSVLVLWSERSIFPNLVADGETGAEPT
jgi:hypothetical protein